MTDAATTDRGRLQRENLYARRAHGCAYTRDELKISYSGRTNRARKACEACTYARPYSYTAFLVVVGCLLYFRFFLRPLVSTPLASHTTRPNEKLVARRETALVKFRPEPLLLVSRNCLTLLSFLSLSLYFLLFFFLFSFFRFCVALRFSKGKLYTLALHSRSLVHCLFATRKF